MAKPELQNQVSQAISSISKAQDADQVRITLKQIVPILLGQDLLASLQMSSLYSDFAVFLLHHVVVDWLPCFTYQEKQEIFLSYFSKAPDLVVFQALHSALAVPAEIGGSL